MPNWAAAAERLAQGTLFSGSTALKSNQPIAKVADSMVGSAEMIAKMLKGTGPQEAFNSTFRPNGELNIGKIAGSYIGVSAGYRVLSGGGAFKDKNGNTNIIGVPFV